MNIRKRNGKLEKLNISNIREQTIDATKGLNASYETLELNASLSFVDGMKSSEIQHLLIKSALGLVDVDKPDYVFVAGRLKLYDIYHQVKRTYSKSKSKEDIYKVITLKDYLEFCKDILSYSSKYNRFDIDKLETVIDSSRDLLFTYNAIDTFSSRYMLKKKKKIVELPQHAFMSIAMFIAQDEENPTEKAIEFYNVMSKLEGLPATPTLANGRTLEGNCFSCAVGSMPDDLEGIFDSFKEIGLGSKFGTGWGYDVTRIRALGGQIRGIPDASNGIVPPMKIMNDISIYVDQLGVRLGAIAVSIESWHKDIIDYLDLKKNNGDERRRAKELFIAVSCSDLFMNRVEKNEMFTLFDPYDVPELSETFSDEFESLYTKYENDFLNGKEFTNTPVRINAKDLWKKLQKMYFETGMPFLFFKDNVNKVHLNKEEGIIRSSNLCTEIFQPTNYNKTILCNLASLNLSKVYTKEDLERVVPIMMRMLDNVIDLSTYPIPGTEEVQKRTRAVGLGVCGEGELLANKQIIYGSEEHLEFIDELYANIAYYSDKTSKELAVERGPWKEGEEHRNAYRRALAPTSSISVIMGTTAMHEGAFDKVWIEETKMGNVKMIAPNINPDNFAFYVSPYDVNQQDAIKCTAIRQKYTDQGISHNIYFRPEKTNGKEVFDTLMLAWKLGLKSTYYLRSESKKVTKEPAIKTTKIACVGCEN